MVTNTQASILAINTKGHLREVRAGAIWDVANLYNDRYCPPLRRC